MPLRAVETEGASADARGARGPTRERRKGIASRSEVGAGRCKQASASEGYESVRFVSEEGHFWPPRQNNARMDAAPKQRRANAFPLLARLSQRGEAVGARLPTNSGAKKRWRRHSLERNFEDPGKLINLEVSNGERANSLGGPGKRGPTACRPRLANKNAGGERVQP